MAPSFWSKTKGQNKSLGLKDWGQKRKVMRRKHVRVDFRARMREITVEEMIDFLWVVILERFEEIDMKPWNRNTDQTLKNIVYNNKSRLELSSALTDICREAKTKKWTHEIEILLDSYTKLETGDKIISNKELLCGVCGKRSLSFNGWMTSVILEEGKLEGESKSGSVIAATPDCLKRVQKYHVAKHFIFNIKKEISEAIERNSDCIHDIKLMDELSQRFYSEYLEIINGK